MPFAVPPPRSEYLSALLMQMIERVTTDPEARARARVELSRLEGSDDFEALRSAILVDAPDDAWTRRARPLFLYVMYAMILSALPIGIVAGFSPAVASAMAAGVRAYLGALPEPLYALFGTGYLGYATLRQWGKVKAAQR